MEVECVKKCCIRWGFYNRFLRIIKPHEEKLDSAFLPAYALAQKFNQIELLTKRSDSSPCLALKFNISKFMIKAVFEDLKFPKTLTKVLSY